MEWKATGVLMTETCVPRSAVLNRDVIDSFRRIKKRPKNKRNY